MRLLFLDLVGWDYDPETPLNEPLGGTQSATAYLTAEIAALGHEVALLAGATQKRHVRGVQVLPRETLSSDLLNGHDLIIVVSGAIGSQIKHIYNPRPPLILWCHHAADQPGVAALAQAEEKAAWNSYVFVSKWQMEQYCTVFGLPRHRGMVIGNGVSPAFLERPPGPAWFETGAAPTLVYSSTPFRGLETLLVAFPAIRARVPDVTLKIHSSMKLYRVEDGADSYRVLYDLARALPGVDYIGPLPQRDLAASMAGAAALSYPCQFAETSCIAAMEAMASGADVITTELGALPETLAGLGRLMPLVAGSTQLAGAFADFVATTLQDARAKPDTARERREKLTGLARGSYHWAARARAWDRLVKMLVR